MRAFSFSVRMVSVRLMEAAALIGPSEAERLRKSIMDGYLDGQKESRIPPNAEFVFYLLLDAKTCDSIVGDLEERYRLVFKKFGKYRADIWYWTQAFRSVGPIAWAWFKKLVMKPVLTGAGWMVAHGLLKDGSALELVKTVMAEWLKRMRG
jgi:hypothetical protein